MDPGASDYFDPLELSEAANSMAALRGMLRGIGARTAGRKFYCRSYRNVA
jgi:hypothetical protein